MIRSRMPPHTPGEWLGGDWIDLLNCVLVAAGMTAAVAWGWIW